MESKERYSITTTTQTKDGSIEKLCIRINDTEAKLSRYSNEIWIPVEILGEFFLRVMREKDKIEAYNNG